jgi:signal peptide peptidase SppA
MNLIEAICSREWAIQPRMLRTILEIANREQHNIVDALQKRDDTLMENTRRVMQREYVAIIPVYGSIFKFANMFTMISGGSSLQMLMKDFNAALENPDIRQIILDIDSPGGEVNGVNEFANAIYEARGQKNIVAYVGGLGASAGYWIASAASKIVIDETAMVGSIGVVASYVDDSERLAKEGVKEIEIVSSTSPNKRPNINSEDGRAIIQRRVDAIQEIFVATVARNRGVSEETVLKDFGQGDIKIGKAAVAAGMADRLGSLEGVIESLNKLNKREAVMAEQETVFKTEEITREMIAERFPVIAEYFRTEGKQAERVRIQEISALARPGLEEIINEAMFHSDDEAGSVALAIIEREKIQRKAAAKAQAEDAAAVPALAAAAPATDEGAELRAIDAAVVAGMNKRFNGTVSRN